MPSRAATCGARRITRVLRRKGVRDWPYAAFNGLVAPLAVPGVLRDPGEFAVIMTGTETGDVRGTVEVHFAQPGPPDLGAWDEIVEISLLLPNPEGAVL
jgi:hypothetical protein